MDWTEPYKWLSFVARDGNGKKLDVGQGFEGEPDFSQYFPIRLRVRIFAVAPGATFVPPDDEPQNDGGMLLDASTPYDRGTMEDGGPGNDARVPLDRSQPDARVDRVESDASMHLDAQVNTADAAALPSSEVTGGCAVRRGSQRLSLLYLLAVGMLLRGRRSQLREKKERVGNRE